MPPGAKKRKALKKKLQQQQQLESTVTSTNTNGSSGDNLNGNNEHGSQEDRESDDSSLSSPASQGNGEFGGTEDPSGLVKDTAKEVSNNGIAIAVERGTDDEKKTVEKLHNPSSENCPQTAKKVACQDADVKENASVSKVMIPEKSEHVDTSAHSNLVNKKSAEKKEYASTGLVKDDGKVATLHGSVTGTSKKVESVRESEVPVSSEKKRLLLPGPPAVRTSWLSCCGLFDAVTGSDR